MSTVPGQTFHSRPILKRTAENVSQFGGHLLFTSFMLSIAAVILSNSFAAPERILLWGVLPIFLATALFPPRDREGNVITRPLFWLGRSFLFWTCVVYVCVAIVSTLASREADQSLSRLINLYGRWGAELLLLIAVTVWLSVIYPGFFKHFLTAMVLLLALNAAINIYAFIPTLVSQPPTSARLSAVFGTPAFRNATHLAPLFAIYAMAAIALIATVRLRTWQKWVFAVCVFILLLAIALTQARGAFVAVFLAGLIIAMTASTSWRFVFGFVVIAAVATAFAVAPVREALLLRGTSFRTELWEAYLQIASGQPWLGYGLDRLMEVKIQDVIFEQPHNALIWTQLRLGLIGTVAAVAMLARSLWVGFVCWRKTGNVAPFIAILMMAVTTITEIGFLVFPYGWIWITFWLPVAIAAGIEVSPTSHRDSHETSDVALP